MANKLAKVTSYLLNSVEFNRWVEKPDKHGTKYKDPQGSPIVIEGRNAYRKRTGMIVPHVVTEIAEEDWNYIKENYKHSPEFGKGFVFSGITTEFSAPNEYGNEPKKAPSAGATVIQA